MALITKWSPETVQLRNQHHEVAGPEHWPQTMTLHGGVKGSGEEGETVMMVLIRAGAEHDKIFGRAVLGPEAAEGPDNVYFRYRYARKVRDVVVFQEPIIIQTAAAEWGFGDVYPMVVNSFQGNAIAARQKSPNSGPFWARALAEVINKI